MHTECDETHGSRDSNKKGVEVIPVREEAGTRALAVEWSEVRFQIHSKDSAGRTANRLNGGSEERKE